MHRLDGGPLQHAMAARHLRSDMSMLRSVMLRVLEGDRGYDTICRTSDGVACEYDTGMESTAFSHKVITSEITYPKKRVVRLWGRRG